MRLGMGSVLLCAALMLSSGSSTDASSFENFGTVTVVPPLSLNGAGTVLDSVAFWEAPDRTNTLMFVTGTGNNRLEVWQYPFLGNELASIQFPANVNGVAVDQKNDRLYVADRIVSVFALPDRQSLGTFGQGIVGAGENSVAILQHASGQAWIYVTDNHNVHRFDADTREHLGSFAPPVSSIETVLADDFHQMILVPEEQGPAGNPGIYAYHPDGTPFLKNGTNRFGSTGVFDSDSEGIVLHRFPLHGEGDDGRGFIVVSDQRGSVTDFEFFDRQTWAHLGRVQLLGVSNTDGIASAQRSLPGYPLGVFAAVDNDRRTAVVGWDAIFTAIGWDLAPETVRITPAATGPTDADSIAFDVVFSEPVTGFDSAADLVITHHGTSSGGVSISGSGAAYTVTVNGIRGVGTFTLSTSTTSDVQDLTTNAHASSVTSQAVRIGSAYHSWASARGLNMGVNDGITDDPDGDGCSNLEEFATDGDPLNAAVSGKTRITLEAVGGSDYFIYTFPARNDAAFAGETMLSASVDGIVYTLSGSSNLVVIDQSFVEIIPALATNLPTLNDGWSYHTFRMSKTVVEIPVGFIRLAITPTSP